MTVIQKIEALSKRLERAKALVKEGKVEKLTHTEWAVDSERDQSKWYLVKLNGRATCSCPDFKRRHEEIRFCKHLLAVEITKMKEADDA